MNSRLDLTSLVPENGTWVELGVAKGNLAKQILSYRVDINYIGVDSWENHHSHEKKIAERDLASFGDRCKIIHSTFEKYCKEVKDNTFDLVFVDGYAHNGQENGKTLQQWWSKVKPGGVMAGHNYCETYNATIRSVDALARDENVGVKIIKEKGTYDSWWIKKPTNNDLMINPRDNVIVVGNGPSLIGSNLGEFIDSFDQVIRFNNFNILNFEKDVGTKTTLWATHGVDQKPVGCDPWPDRMLLVPHRKTPYGATRMWSVSRPFYDLMRDRVKAFSEWDESKKPRLLCSTGVITVAWLIHEFSLRKVTVVGFDHFSKEKLKEHHYWDNRAFAKPVEHDGDSERKLLELCYPGRIIYKETTT